MDRGFSSWEPVVKYSQAIHWTFPSCTDEEKWRTASCSRGEEVKEKLKGEGKAVGELTPWGGGGAKGVGVGRGQRNGENQSRHRARGERGEERSKDRENYFISLVSRGKQWLYIRNYFRKPRFKFF